LLSLLVPALAHGKAEPTPKNYQTKVDAIKPDVKGLEVTTEGGDRYLVLKNDTGKVVSISGYDDEPYLRFLPTGEVQVNANSPATYLNRIRFGTPDSVTIPRSALAGTKVKWQKVSGDGTYKWFDHRIHWMEKDPPPVVRDESKRTKIFDWQVPARAGDTPVTVAGTLTWIPTAASSDSGLSGGAIAAIIAGAIVLLGLAALLLQRRRGGPDDDDGSGAKQEQPAKEAW
jgi:hypothetical protein